MSKKTRKALAGLLCLCLVFSCLSGCGKNQAGSGAGDDILSQKTTPKGRTPITVLVKYAFIIDTFEAAVEEKFPDIDLIQVGNYTYDRGLVEYNRRMEHDDLTDIVMTWPLDVGEEYWEDRLLDLSGMSFTGNYNTSMLDNISEDGKLYYLPGPAQVRGIVYNKTLFAENGWEVPEDFDGFVALCQEIEKSGIRSIQLGFQNSEVLDTAFMGWSYGSCYSTPKDAQWIADYNKGTGSFGDHFGPALDTFQTLIDAGVWKKEDLAVDYSTRERMLFSRACAMVEDSALMTHMGYDMAGSTDEFALMPFFSPEKDGDWARLYMVCYIGLNKHLAENANKEKYDMVMKLMEYISSAEGQAALMADNGTMYSSVKGVSATAAPEIDDLRGTLDAGRSAVFTELENAQSALREGLAGMLAGELTRDDVMRMVDEQNSKPPEAAVVENLGTVTADFTLIETGNFIADVMRQAAGSDVALFLDNGKDGRYNGKGVSGRLYSGTLTTEDIKRIMPDTKRGEKGTLEVVTMTGADLIKSLEYAITVDNGSAGWFYYFSGLKLTYAPAAQPGSRIKSITTADGEQIDEKKTYTVAVMDGSYSEDNVLSCETTGLSIAELLKAAIQKTGSISPGGDGRFTVAEP